MKYKAEITRQGTIDSGFVLQRENKTARKKGKDKGREGLEIPRNQGKKDREAEIQS